MAVTDSSPIIRRLEATRRGRSVIPPDAALALLDMLLEDYADEWLTKAMFHYRWAYAPDIKRSSEVIPHWRGLSRPDEEMAAAARAFGDRQIGRLRYVGSNATTGPLIEASYLRFVDLLNAHLRGYPYLMGRRPGASDFAVYGQLTQLALFDPTPMALTMERAPRVAAWVGLMDDLSGEEPHEGDWLDAGDLPQTLLALLREEVARTYMPVMLANARAQGQGEAEFTATVDDRPWTQQVFPYQAKCLAWLREAYSGLAQDRRKVADGVLAATRCAPIFQEATG